ncbi:MAG: NrsF family protein [Gemmatimonadota bacterium]
MSQRTNELIQQLAAAGAVRRLPHPALRALLWLGLAAAHVALVASAIRPRADLATVLGEAGFVVPVLISLIVASLAAVAAFAMSVPGYPAWRRLALIGLPLLWLASYAGNAAVSGAAAPADIVGWECMPLLLVFGGVPLMVIALMLRQSAPMTPVRTLVLGAVAAGALADVGTRLCHSAAAEAHLVWHALAAFVLIAVGAVVAGRVLRWQRD